MKKIITALANPELNEEIIKTAKYQIINQDIQYQEGVIELLEKNNDVDVLILNSILPGEINIKEFINKIKEINNTIEIIIILEKEDEEIKNFLISKGIFKIFYNNKITIKEIINLLENNLKENKINEEIKILKELIINNKNNTLIKSNKYKLINKIKNNINSIKNKINKKKIINNKIISIVGPAGVGKSIFASILAKSIKNKKILIIDFDSFNSSINTIFGVKKHFKKINKNKTNEEIIIKINKKLSLICDLKIFFHDNKINENKFKNIINQLNKKHDLLIIDTSAQENFKDISKIIKNSDAIIFLTETNLLQLKKTNKLLDIYINKFEIKKEKINIVFNKYNINSIDKKILKELFSDFNILGEIKLNKNYDLIINNNINNLNKKIKLEFNNIIKKIKL